MCSPLSFKVVALPVCKVYAAWQGVSCVDHAHKALAIRHCQQLLAFYAAAVLSTLSIGHQTVWIA